MNSFSLVRLNQSISHICKAVNVKSALELQPASQTVISSRNTYILKRRYPIRLPNKGAPPKPLKQRDYVYDLVENRDMTKKPEVTVILKEYVEGVGQQGDVVTVRRNVAYNDLLLPGRADYATPEAIEQAKLRKGSQTAHQYSSLEAPIIQKYLENFILTVLMNKENEWTLEPWHIRVNFRKAGIYIPEEAIEIPSKPIKGPNPELETKAFCVTVTINKREKATVRCILHHWSGVLGEGIHDKPFTKPLVCIFPEDEEKIQKLPPIQFKSVTNT